MSPMRSVGVLMVKVIMLFADASFTTPEGMLHVQLFDIRKMYIYSEF